MAHYFICKTAFDYKKAHELIKSEGQEDCPLSFPTCIAADDNGDLIGVIGTNTDQGMIICGPLVIRSDKRHIFVMIRLIDFYERVMRDAGVKAFVFSAPLDKSEWIQQIQTVYELKPYAIKNGHQWFVRNLE